MYDRITLAIPRARGIAAPLWVLVLVWSMLSALPARSLDDSSVGQPAEERLVDVGLLIFDPGIPPDKSTHSKLGIFPEIRKSEAKYMPVILREVFLESEQWGVVRVLPDALESSELLVTGRILHSDGLRLELHIQAHDATGAQWLDKVYAGNTTPADYPVKIPGDPYLSVYHQIVDDLRAVLQQKSSKQLRTMREVALMRYASGLAPEVFASYLTQTPEGEYSLLRFPAQGDPMLARVIRIRNQEYLFIDTVDEQYARLGEEMAPTYNLWRQFGAEQALYKETYQ
jgi:hypothetical protein